jgi:hypothetical protein
MGRRWPPVDQALPVPGLAFRPLSRLANHHRQNRGFSQCTSHLIRLPPAQLLRISRFPTKHRSLRRLTTVTRCNGKAGRGSRHEDPGSASTRPDGGAAAEGAMPTCLRSSAATAVTSPTSITARSHRSFNGPAGHTPIAAGVPAHENTSGCTAHPPASLRLADPPDFQPRDASGRRPLRRGNGCHG